MSFSKSSTVPINMLPGLGYRTAKALRRLDIYTVGQFKETPEKILVELFGPSIRKLYKQVNPLTATVVKAKPRKKKRMTVGQQMRVATLMLTML